MDPSTLKPCRSPAPRWARACYGASFLLTIFALQCDTVTLTTGDYRAACVLACCGATGAVTLIAVAWERMSIFRQILMALFLIADAWVLLDAGLIRLLGSR